MSISRRREIKKAAASLNAAFSFNLNFELGCLKSCCLVGPVTKGLIGRVSAATKMRLFSLMGNFFSCGVTNLKITDKLKGTVGNRLYCSGHDHS
jgi:hypothetical protein